MTTAKLASTQWPQVVEYLLPTARAAAVMKKQYFSERIRCSCHNKKKPSRKGLNAAVFAAAMMSALSFIVVSQIFSVNGAAFSAKTRLKLIRSTPTQMRRRTFALSLASSKNDGINDNDKEATMKSFFSSQQKDEKRNKQKNVKKDEQGNGGDGFFRFPSQQKLDKDNVKKTTKKDKEGSAGDGFFRFLSQREDKKDNESKTNIEGRGGDGFFGGMFRQKKEKDGDNDDEKKRKEQQRLQEQRAQAKKKRQEEEEKKNKLKEAKRRKQELERNARKAKRVRANQLKAKKQKESITKENSFEDSGFGRLLSVFNNSTVDDKKELKGKKTNEDWNPVGSAQKFVSGMLNTEGREQWVDVLPKTGIAPGAKVPVTVGGLDLLLIASKDGRRLHCLANACPHLGTPLELGLLVRLPTVDSSSSGTTFTTNKKEDSLVSPDTSKQSPWTESEIADFLTQDGCEDCIVCPTHRTAFALESGEVRGPWCPYPPGLGKLVGAAKKPTAAATFDVRTRGKFVQVRINTPIQQQ